MIWGTYSTAAVLKLKTRQMHFLKLQHDLDLRYHAKIKADRQLAKFSVKGNTKCNKKTAKTPKNHAISFNSSSLKGVVFKHEIKP